jgi:hypothetical protein
MAILDGVWTKNDIVQNGDHLKSIPDKFSLYWMSSFREEVNFDEIIVTIMLFHMFGKNHQNYKYHRKISLSTH